MKLLTIALIALTITASIADASRYCHPSTSGRIMICSDGSSCIVTSFGRMFCK